MVLDTLGWLAVTLGALALGIAVWDHVRDRYYDWRPSGPVSADLETFDIPQPGVRGQTVGPRGSPREVRGTRVRTIWALHNHLSWPVYASFSVRHTLGGDGILWSETWDELCVVTGDSALLPPRQPVRRTFWIVCAEGQEGEITPRLFVRARRDATHQPFTKRLRWSGGAPSLEA